MLSRPIRRGGLTAVAATLLLAGPAGAHPLFEPDEVPVDALAGITLDLAHGCAAEEDDPADDGDGEPTREVAIEVPDAVSWVEPAEADGWDLEVEVEDDPAGDASGEVLVYTAQPDTDDPAPRFDLEVVHRGEVDDEVAWRVVQACDGTTHRWVGTDEEPAAEPAVTVTLVEADPDAPPPPDGAADDGAVVEEPADPSSDAPAPDDPDDGGDAGAQDAPDGAADGTDGEDTDDDAGGLLPGWALVVVLVATLGIAGIVLLLRDRDPTPDPDTGGAGPDGSAR